MSTRTNDWSSSAPIDHTQIKSLPAAIRRAFIDMEDRLNDILGGFVAGETVNGIKLGKFLTVGTEHPSAPGVGDEAAIDVYAITVGSYIHLYAQDTDGNKVFLAGKGAQLPNDTYFKVFDASGTGSVNTFKVDTAGNIIFAEDVAFTYHPTAPDTGPTEAAQYAPKGYVDTKFPVNLATPDTGINGTLGTANGGTGKTTKLVNKVTYTGTGADKDVAHGLGATPDRIEIIRTDSGSGMILWTEEFAVGYSLNTSDGSLSVDRIDTVDGTNVNLGTSALTNASGGAFVLRAYIDQ